MSQSITVFGSCNIDHVVRTARVPEAGETLQASALEQLCGGKGMNQAVACARLGSKQGKTQMVGRVGNDDFGDTLVQAMHAEGIDAAAVRRTDGPTGVSTILVEEASGENRILYYPGANFKVRGDDLLAARLESSAMLLLQAEIPLEAILYAMDYAHSHHIPILLNPAPAVEIPSGYVEKIKYLVLNEGEAQVLSKMHVTDADTAKDAALHFIQQGVECCVITRGAQGALWATRHHHGIVDAAKVTAVDTTGAGDTFVGAFAVNVVAGQDIPSAVQRGVEAATIAVTRLGGQKAIPYADDLDLCRMASQ